MQTFGLAALIASDAMFVFDSAVRGLWANLLLSLVLASVLAVVLWNIPSSSEPQRIHLPVQGSVPSELNHLLDQIQVPMVSLRPNDVPHAINRAARSLFDTDDIIIKGRDDLIRAMISPLTEEKFVIPVFDRQYAVSVSEITAGEATYRLGTLTDIQGEIHKTEASTLRDTLSILSHEIMNSLTPVASLAEIANSYLTDETSPGTQSARKALDTLQRRATGLKAFIEAYRSVARLPPPDKFEVDIGRLLNDVVSLFQLSSMAPNVIFTLDLEPSLPRFWLDEAQITQAIINVVTNAVEASDTLAVVPKINIRAFRQKNDLIITITDNGEGISDNIRENLFTAFATTKVKGTGTGLNLARQIALAHGGNLQLTGSQPGETIFSFSFLVRD